MTQQEKIEAAQIINDALTTANLGINIPHVSWQNIVDGAGFLAFNNNNPVVLCLQLRTSFS